MKLFRWLQQGRIKTGVIVEGKTYDISPVVSEFDENFFASGGLEKLKQESATRPLWTLMEGPVSYAAPVARPSKILCVGLNYADHARETNAKTPTEPILFIKSTTSLSGPNDPVMLPKGSEKTDWEVELAVVISKTASYVDEADAAGYIAGYCLHNDVSERAFQLERGGTWDKGKGCDTFAPLGPWLVTPDEIADVDNLRLWLTVNGVKRQDGNTSDLIFRIPFLIHYISQFMTLLPGDVISTGTPAGVALGMPTPEYLKAGDIVELGIDGLGTSRQEVIAWARN